LVKEGAASATPSKISDKTGGFVPAFQVAQTMPFHIVPSLKCLV